MDITYNDLESAFLFVSTAPMYTNHAFLNKETGQFFYSSENGDSNELPQDIDEASRYVAIPHKNELDLGKDLVFRFIEDHALPLMNEVQRIFRKRGAYGRYKDLLDRHGILQQWYNFEANEQKSALKEWCEENDIKLTADR